MRHFLSFVYGTYRTFSSLNYFKWMLLYFLFKKDVILFFSKSLVFFILLSFWTSFYFFFFFVFIFLIFLYLYYYRVRLILRFYVKTSRFYIFKHPFFSSRSYSFFFWSLYWSFNFLALSDIIGIFSFKVVFFILSVFFSGLYFIIAAYRFINFLVFIICNFHTNFSIFFCIYVFCSLCLFVPVLFFSSFVFGTLLIVLDSFFVYYNLIPFFGFLSVPITSFILKFYFDVPTDIYTCSLEQGLLFIDGEGFLYDWCRALQRKTILIESKYFYKSNK